MFRMLVLLYTPTQLEEILGGERFISREDYRSELERHDNLPEEIQAHLREVMIEYWLEIYDMMDKQGFPLPPVARES